MEPKDNILDYPSVDFPADKRIITIKHFYFEAPARLYLARLREAGIQSFISNTNTITAFPLGDGGIGLHICQKDHSKALTLVKELDQNNRNGHLNFSFREADHEDIAFEKSLSTGRKTKDRLLLFLFLMLSLILLRAFMRASGLLFWQDHL